jgi:hypothetical protein
LCPPPSPNQLCFRNCFLNPTFLSLLSLSPPLPPPLVQHECIPQAILGVDIICQAKSGMGKTAVFVLSTLHLMEPVDNEVSCLVLTHTRELAFQIAGEYKRFTKYLPEIRSAVFFGGNLYSGEMGRRKGSASRHQLTAPGGVGEGGSGREKGRERMRAILRFLFYPALTPPPPPPFLFALCRYEIAKRTYQQRPQPCVLYTS